MEFVQLLILLTGLLNSKYTTAGHCSGSVFTCSNGQCVPHSWRCDHSRDCEDGSDEENCSQNECEVNNGGCSHVCLDLPLGFLCDCPPNMRLVQDTYCEEVDHCLDADVCDQMCVHSNDTLTCECQEGYLKNSENGSCIATGDAERGVIFFSSAGICWMNSSDSVQKQLTNCTGAPGPLAAFTAHRTIYWSSPEHKGVYRLSLDGVDKDPAVLFEGHIGIVGLAVDWVYERLYWISTDTRALHVTALNGSEHAHAQLITSLNNPTAIAVQPLLGLLFWADIGVSPRIERSSLDGENRKALITSIIHNPVSICLDIARGLLYWADSGLHTISRARYDGQHRKTVVESNGYLDEPLGLAVFEGRVYWTDRLTGSICSADKHNGKQLTVMQNDGTRFPAGLIIYHTLLQPTGTVLSPAKAVDAVSASAFPWIPSLIVVLCILLVVLLVVWWRTETSASSPFFDFENSTLKESQDPLVPTTHRDTLPDQVGINVEL